MTLTKKDWQRLQWGIILLVALSAAGATIVTMSMKNLADTTKSNLAAKKSRDAARDKAARADQEAAELREKIAVFQELEQRGIIGQEHRLDWIEKIRKVKKARKLVSVDYEMSPQRQLDARIVPSAVNGFSIMASPMKLKLALLHENDLLNFLADLRADIQGYIRVGNCNISRGNVAAADKGPAAQLLADCELQWITIRSNR